MVGSQKSFTVYKNNKKSNLLILCDHASYYIPKKYKNLGVDIDDVKKHIGWDIGALKVAKKVVNKVNGTLIYSGYSRLLIDCNRSLKSKGAFIKKSENISIPGNDRITKKEKLNRARKYYFPYHNKIDRIINEKLKNNIVPILISIHSFTPVYFEKRRPWHIGLLQRADTRLSSIFKKEIKKYKKINLGINQPYKLDLAGDFTVPFFSESYGLPHILIEIKQDLLLKNNSVNFWSNLISKILEKHYDKNILKKTLKPSNKIIKYYKERNNL